MASNLHISISAEPLFEIGGFTVTNSTFTALIVSAFLISFALFYTLTTKKSLKPGSKLQLFVEMIIEALYNLTSEIAGHKKAPFFFPFIASSFFFILFNNWFGLLPGVGTIGITESEPTHMEEVAPHDQEAANPISVQAAEETLAQDTDSHQEEVADDHSEAAVTEESHSEESTEEEAHAGPAFVPIFRAATADLNTTLALALISVGLTQYFGFRYLGLSYLKKFFNFSNPIYTFVGLLEIISEFAKIISFALRLFGNIFAGEVLLAVIAFLVPVIAPMPFIGLEIFVGLIQALVFAMSSLVFINMATHSHDH